MSLFFTAGGNVGDKSPKSKKRDQKQKTAAKAQNVANAKAKRDGSGGPLPPVKGKKGG